MLFTSVKWVMTATIPLIIDGEVALIMSDTFARRSRHRCMYNIRSPVYCSTYDRASTDQRVAPGNGLYSGYVVVGKRTFPEFSEAADAL